MYKIGFITFACIAIAAQLARAYDWYTLYSYTDRIMHTFAGIMFAALWIGFSKKKIPQKNIMYITALMASVSGSVLWEIWEYFVFPRFEFLARHYRPELFDTLDDIALGFLGSAAFIAALELIDMVRTRSSVK